MQSSGAVPNIFIEHVDATAMEDLQMPEYSEAKASNKSSGRRAQVSVPAAAMGNARGVSGGDASLRVGQVVAKGSHGALLEHSEMEKHEPERRRRYSEQAPSSSAAAASAAASEQQQEQPPQTPPRKHSAVKQFLENFRPRAKTENAQLLAKSSKKRHDSADSSSCPPDEQQQQQQQQQQLSSPAAAGGSIKRARSPVGGLVNRLRTLGVESSASAERRRRRSSGNQPQALPHPSEMPLDHSFCADVSRSSNMRLRKTVSTDDSNSRVLSHPPSLDRVHEKHRDLFEQLTHSPDAEGQCSIQSAAALAESQQRKRRMSGPTLSVPASTRQRAASGSDVQVTEDDKFIIFKSRCQSEEATDFEQLRTMSSADSGKVFSLFASKQKCYELMPNSGKLLVFDTMLNVKKAFFALVYNGLRAAPLWDSTQQKFAGMFTVTDFIHMLLALHRSAMLSIEELESHQISTWRSQLDSNSRQLLWISPEAALLDAVRLLLQQRVHRLPVIDPISGNALFIITHKRIMRYFHINQHLFPMPNWLQKSIKQLNIGTFANIVTISDTATLAHALSLFDLHRVSAIPVVDSAGRLADIYSKFDVINLAATKTYHELEVSVGTALQYRHDRFEGVYTCNADDSLQQVIDRLVTAEVHRLIAVDDDRKITGIVSLSDVLMAIVLQHEQLDAAAAAAAADS